MGRGQRAGRPGDYARQRYRRGVRRWRAKIRLRLIAVLSPLVLVGVLLGVRDPHWTQWFAGAAFGGALSLWMWVRDAPPHYVENWQRGFEGEMQTARALAALPAGWRVWHDVPATYGNFDHIVVGPAGVFVLDSKLFRGELRVDDRGARLLQALDDDNEFGLGGMTRKVVSLAVDLRSRLRDQTLFTEHVHAVVVLWSPFPQIRSTEGRCTYLAGKELVAWLLEQPARTAPAHVQRLAAAIDAPAEARRRPAP